ncbi:MAG: DNA mismatch repair endonuclease MutL [Candidatus Omnitrophota bacterium]
MTNVNILSPEVISKIAAGEVIERPASCVKELLENALDAGTGSVELSLKNAGKTLISLKDTGRGIYSDDIEKVFMRHSTSKIKDIVDLDAINSLGFRGEALYSIGAISDVILRSRTPTDDNGWEIHVMGGKNLGVKPVSMEPGTDIEIRELFFNTPARRKFMKADAAEMSQILAVFTPYALLYPSIRFLLTHNGKSVIDLGKAPSHIDRIADALHLKKGHIIEAYRKSDDGSVSVRLFLGDINIQRPRRDLQYLFINSRPVQNFSVPFHMNQVYRLLLPQDVHPFFAAFVDMPPGDLDVNVHPAKREVRIRDDKELIRTVRHLCEHALMTAGKPKMLSDDWMKAVPASSGTAALDAGAPPSGQAGTEEKPERQYVLHLGAKRDTTGEDPESRGQAAGPDSLKAKLSGARYIGAFIKKYLLFEAGQSLILVDQHAAQERVAFERLLCQINSNSVETQQLLAPYVLSLNTEEMLAWKDLGKILEGIGFQTTMFDRECIAVHSHPVLISNPELAVRSILAGIKVEKCDNEKLSRWACRSSVMAGDSMPDEGAALLRDQLLKCNDPFTCPHGRPTLIEMDDKFLSRQFLR